LDIILAPDVYVNASVALGSPPEHVVRRVLGHSQKHKTTEWVLTRVEAMLHVLPAFKEDAVKAQMKTIRELVEIVEADEAGPDEWEKALVAAAKAAGVDRVVTDHPDLADKDEAEGIFFISSDAYMVELTTPPPPPGS